MRAILILSLLLMTAGLYAQRKADNPQMPVRQYFVENKGQWPSEVLYLTRSAGMDAWITRQGVVYDFHLTTTLPGKRGSLHLPQEALGNREKTKMRWGQVVRWHFETVNEKASASGLQPGAARENYYRGSDPAKWVQGARTFQEVWVKNLYPGVDVHYFFDNGHLRYDYIVHPGANPEAIRWQVLGADGLGKDTEGNLLVNTRFGSVKHARLYAYQDRDGVRQQVPCAFSIADDRVQFDVGTYLPQYDLVIDPQVWGTFLGGSGDDGINGAVVSANGNVIVTGATSSANFPAVTGAYDGSPNGGADLFVAGISANGSQLLFSTFVGGSGDEGGIGIALDATGNIIVGGSTNSANFPVTGGAFDETANGGASDGVILKLNATGSALQFSTYLGGGAADELYALKTDATGNVYACGATESNNFPTTAGAFDRSFGGGSEDFPNDGFVVKLNAAGSALLYGTYLGGSQGDLALSMVVLADGSACVTGFAESADYPSTAGSYSATAQGGGDVFVTKVNPSGSGLVFSTFVGGMLSELAFGIAADANNDLYVTGWAMGLDFPGLVNFPVTPDAYDVTFNGGSNDIFVFKLKGDGTSLLFSTWLGGDKADEIFGTPIAVDAAGNVVVSGMTESANFPTTAGAFDATLNGTAKDAFVSVLRADGKALLYSSYVGGSGEEGSYGLAMGNNGQVFLFGQTASSDFPVTTGSYDNTYNGGADDGYLVLMNLSGVLPVVLTDWKAMAVNNSHIQLHWTTASETNSRGFEVQRSTNGVDFEKIGWVNAAGNAVSKRIYSHADRQVQPGILYFYRLKQRDLDGQEVFSQVASAQLSKAGQPITISPNPARGTTYLLSDQALQHASVRVYNNAGSVVMERHRQSGNRVAIPLASLPAGVYWVQVSANEAVQVIRLVKE